MLETSRIEYNIRCYKLLWETYTFTSLATTESISHKFLNILYLDYHSWTYITTTFQYHYLLFDIRNVSKKKSDIFTPTKHLDRNQLWKIQKSDCFKKGIPHAL